MDLEKTCKDVAEFSLKLDILLEYISIKFGSDFKEFWSNRLPSKKSKTTPSSKDSQEGSSASSGFSSSKAYPNRMRLRKRGKKGKKLIISDSEEDSEQEKDKHKTKKIKSMELDKYIPALEDDESSSQSSEDSNGMDLLVPLEGIKTEQEFYDESQAEGGFEMGTIIDVSGSGIGDINEDGSGNSKQIQNTRKESKIYKIVQKFSSLAEAKTFVSNDWKYHNKYKTQGGERHQYDCRKCSKCPTKCRIALKCNSNVVEVHVTTNDHDHSFVKKKCGLDDAVKAEIISLLDNAVSTPKMIHATLTQNNVEISFPQLKNFLTNYKIKMSKSKE